MTKVGIELLGQLKMKIPHRQDKFKLLLIYGVVMLKIPEAEARCLAVALPACRVAAGSVPRWSVLLPDRRAWGPLEARPLAPDHSERSVGARQSHSGLRHTAL